MGTVLKVKNEFKARNKIQAFSLPVYDTEDIFLALQIFTIGNHV
jgi:hypothetical protein